MSDNTVFKLPREKVAELVAQVFYKSFPGFINRGLEVEFHPEDDEAGFVTVTVGAVDAPSAAPGLIGLNGKPLTGV